jgi:SAM-dependent methyltransferase
MTGEKPDYDLLYAETLQGDFYGADYYRPPASEIDSAIIYDDNEDKRATAAFVVLAFGPRRILEVGCAMGLLVKALRGWGVDAEGVDFSRWCVNQASPAVRDRVRWGDILSLPRPVRPYDVILALDILEHLPPARVPGALANLAAALRPGGLVFTVVPAYGPNAFGPELYPLQYEEWRRDAADGRPFRNIPLDDKGRPHLGHLTHAAIPWWERAFRRAGLKRLGEVEKILHERFDASFEYPRRSFFLFVRAGRWGRAKAARRLMDRAAAVPGLPYGFYEWERWGEDVWMRWTTQKAWDPLPVAGRSEFRLRAICNHPGIGDHPVRVAFRVEGGGETLAEFRDHDWHDVKLALPGREFAELRVECSRTWTPNDGTPPERRRRLGVGISYPRE